MTHPAASLVAAMEHSDLYGPFFDGASWSGWKAVLKAATGLSSSMTSEELEFFRTVAERDPPSQPVREFYAVCGRGSGKNSVSSALQAHTAANFRGQSRLRPGERVASVCVANDRDQSGIQLGYIRALFGEVEALHRKVRRNVQFGIELDNRADISIFTNSFRAVRGRSILFSTLDEVAFFRGPDDATLNADVELYNALRPGLARVPDSMLVAISSPYRRAGLLFTKFRDHFGKDSDDVLVIKAPTNLLNPTFPADVIAKAYEEDPAVAAAEYGGEFRTDLSNFVDRDVILDCVSPGLRERPFVSGKRYTAHVDPSGGISDSFTLAVAHMECDIPTLDCIREVKPPFSPEAVAAEFAGTLKSYRVNRVSGDRYAGEWPREQFRKRGVEYITAEKTASDFYRDALPLLNSRRADLLDNQRLVSQLAGLERRVGRSGKDTISHRVGSHDDVANVAAAVLCSVAKPNFASMGTVHF